MANLPPKKTFEWPSAAHRFTAGSGMPEPAKVTHPAGGRPGMWGPQADIAYVGDDPFRHMRNADGEPPRLGPSGKDRQKAVIAGWSGRTRNEAPKAD
jgi:hypothetical protein